MFLGWPQFDQDAVVALGRVERNTGRYGEWIPDAMSVRADPEYYGDDAIRFIPDGPYTNQAERVVEESRRTLEKQSGEGANLSGVFWRVEATEFGSPA